MSTVDEKTVRHVAKLARLTLTEPEVQQFTQELSKILGMVDQLNAADVSQLDDTLNDMPLPTVQRVDAPRPHDARHIILENAPAVEETYFQVPKILEG